MIKYTITIKAFFFSLNICTHTDYYSVVYIVFAALSQMAAEPGPSCRSRRILPPSTCSVLGLPGDSMRGHRFTPHQPDLNIADY